MPSFSLPEVLNCLFLLFFSYAVCLSDIFQFKKKTLPQGGVAVRVESGSREPSCMLWEMAFIIKATPHFISRSVPTMCGNHPPNPKFRSNSSDSCLLQDLEPCYSNCRLQTRIIGFIWEVRPVDLNPAGPTKSDSAF